jgi:hypothetical protein
MKTFKIKIKRNSPSYCTSLRKGEVYEVEETDFTFDYDGSEPCYKFISAPYIFIERRDCLLYFNKNITDGDLV